MLMMKMTNNHKLDACNMSPSSDELGHGMCMRVKFQFYDFVPALNEIMFWDFEWKLDELKYNHLRSWTVELHPQFCK